MFVIPIKVCLTNQMMCLQVYCCPFFFTQVQTALCYLLRYENALCVFLKTIWHCIFLVVPNYRCPSRKLVFVFLQNQSDEQIRTSRPPPPPIPTRSDSDNSISSSSSSRPAGNKTKTSPPTVPPHKVSTSSSVHSLDGPEDDYEPIHDYDKPPIEEAGDIPPSYRAPTVPASLRASKLGQSSNPLNLNLFHRHILILIISICFWFSDCVN